VALKFTADSKRELVDRHFDTRTGKELGPALVEVARKEELAYMKKSASMKSVPSRIAGVWQAGLQQMGGREQRHQEEAGSSVQVRARGMVMIYLPRFRPQRRSDFSVKCRRPVGTLRIR
jgi:hypothetical protein